MKKVYWIKHTHLFAADEYVCSNCGKKSEKPTQFCPRCGAKMAGVKTDANWADEMEAVDSILDD